MLLKNAILQSRSSVLWAKLNKLNKALENAEKANKLIMKGHKHAANYIELFHEIYPVQTERLIDRIEDQMKVDHL